MNLQYFWGSLYIENSKESIGKLLKIIKTFTKIAEYSINTKKPIILPGNCNLKKIKAILFTIVYEE